MARSLRLSALLALAALGLGLAEVPQRRASPRPQKLAKDHAMMQVFADTVSGADRKDKFKVVKRQRPASPPPCPETDDEPEADNCEILDELSLGEAEHVIATGTSRWAEAEGRWRGGGVEAAEPDRR
eukprot:CAMPEP_0171195694 /NCGR_PEP_ID=MMETSP0790-20130122/21524_1 /TAXON_ID=2925 /ORGANISM="Alexandrium catenella, Strain OF101" /LENGTH=126 /DNA_ID=CAMNT_0011660905 /DNA_START=78 /DNA_END=455 /DNA_ORIENTATION=-